MMSKTTLSSKPGRYQLLIGAAVVVLTIASGFVDRRLSMGLSTNVDLAPVGKHLETLPEQLGEWQLQASRPMEPQIVATLQCSGNVLRKYINRATGEVIDLSIIVGPAGPTSVHTPEVCYSSRDYEQLGVPKEFQVRARENPLESFWGLSFRARGPRPDQLTVAYAWNDGDGWRAASHPRFQYSGRRMLYKLQLASNSIPSETSSSHDPIRSFLVDFLPVFDALLEKSPHT
jgi:Protein of unknown function (DUF3485)